MTKPKTTPRMKPGPKGPTKPASPRGPFIVEDDVWEKAQIIAKRRGETVSTAIRRSLDNYVRNYRHLLRDDQ